MNILKNESALIVQKKASSGIPLLPLSHHGVRLGGSGREDKGRG
jgi:hypothetical protein